MGMLARAGLPLGTAITLIAPLLLATSWAAVEEAEVLLAGDECADGSEQCELSLRQLRGELKPAVASPHVADADSPGDVEDEDDMDVVYGPFCCQNGGGRGYADPEDVGGSCYPTAKAELDGFCDSAAHCTTDCNGTWVEGFCGFPAEGKEGSPVCKAALKGPKSLRAPQDSKCATQATCGGCKGTWCHYVKSHPV
mmetsp:Transcript_10209/g.30705  ORF Transcript_10209/g.30705 Transcript_10209/m.30705 type:complete len:196 (-) Transcript_10209:90-677(-)